MNAFTLTIVKKHLQNTVRTETVWAATHRATGHDDLAEKCESNAERAADEFGERIMSRYIMSERQAEARAEADVLYQRALAVGISRQKYNTCPHLKAAREMVEAAEQAMTPVDVTEMQATLEASLDEAISPKRANEVMLELIDLQFAIEKANGAIDSYFDGRVMARNLSDSY